MTLEDHRSLKTVEQSLRDAAEAFRSKGIDSPRLDAELLLGFLLKLDRVKLLVAAPRALTSDEEATFRELVARRLQYEPIAYITGEREFYGLSFSIDRRVLVPRPDSEVLVETALRRMQISSAPRVLDLCTGSGCVAIAIAKTREDALVWATDIDRGALDLASENATRLGAKNVTFLGGDLFSAVAFGETFDLITANPPYIPNGDREGLQADVRDHEPAIALFSGATGLEFYERIAKEVHRSLRPNGVLAVEVGMGQAKAVEALFYSHGAYNIERTRDLQGIERVVSAQFAEATRKA